MQTGYKVGDVMTNKPVVASKDMPLMDAARMMTEANVNSLLIVEGEEPVAIITDEDIVRKAVSKGLDIKKLKVKDVAVTDLLTIAPEKDIYDALMLMREHNIRQLPVVKRKKLLGFLTSKDILKIEPELIDILVEKYELRNEQERLEHEIYEKEDIFSDFFRKIGIKKKKK
jgi:CBS domain-containing protein